MPTAPAKALPFPEDRELLYEDEWREELDRRCETPDEKWLDAKGGTKRVLERLFGEK